MIKENIIALAVILILTVYGFCQAQVKEEINTVPINSKTNSFGPADNLKGDEVKILVENLRERIRELDEKNKTKYQDLLNNISDINKLQERILKDIKSLNEKIDSLRMEHDKIEKNVNNLSENTEQEIIIIKKSILSKFIVTGASILILLLSTVLIVVFFQKKFKKINVLEESIKLDAKMSEMLEKQLLLMRKEVIEKRSGDESAEINHSLPIKVGTEIFRMRKRIEHMDENTKGLNALKAALNRLEDEFNQQGYSIKDLTNLPYTDELTVKVLNYIQREDINAGKSIISRMITPQIYHKGIVVSNGEAEVAVSAEDVLQH